jgi:hypothetical protein
VLAPTAFDVPDRHLVGAEQIHGVFKGWLQEVGGARAGA